MVTPSSRAAISGPPLPSHNEGANVQSTFPCDGDLWQRLTRSVINSPVLQIDIGLIIMDIDSE